MKNSKWVFLILLWLPTASVIAMPLAIITPELSRALAVTPADEEVSIIVTLADRLDIRSVTAKDKATRRTKLVTALKEHARQSQKGVVCFLAEKNVEKIKSFWLFNGLAVTARPSVIHELATQPGIKSIRLDSSFSVPHNDRSSL